MEPITLFLVAGYILVRWLNSARKSNHSSTAPAVLPPKRIITFIGAASAGKSSTINALVGSLVSAVDVGHSTTTSIVDIPYKSSYLLRDTPGFLDIVRSEKHVWPKLQESQVIVYVASGQLYEPEVQILRSLHQSQAEWDSLSSTPGHRKLILYINKDDVRRATMTSRHIANMRAAIEAQTVSIVRSDHIVYGSSAPKMNGSDNPPEIYALRDLIESFIS